jgi:predicted phage gp36 major capsid-like protein
VASEDRIQELNRALRELASNARKAREEFERYADRSRRDISRRPERDSAVDSDPPPHNNPHTTRATIQPATTSVA